MTASTHATRLPQLSRARRLASRPSTLLLVPLAASCLILTSAPADAAFGPVGRYPGAVLYQSPGAVGASPVWPTSAAGIVQLALLAPAQSSSLFQATAPTPYLDGVVTLSQDKVANGNGVYVSYVARRVAGGGAYLSKVRLASDGSVRLSLVRRDVAGAEVTLMPETVLPGLTAGSAEELRLRVQAIGTAPTALKAKLWRAGSIEPSGWSATATDSTPSMQGPGDIGVSAYLSGAASNAPIGLTFSHFATNRTGPVPVVPGAPSRASLSAGSLAVGGAQYAVPSGALFVSPTGNDAGSGAMGSPWRTVGRAVSAAPSGSTLVLRGGAYHESVTIPAGRALTVQNYPGEAVWFDGSRSVSNWQPDGGTAWRADGWTVRFDHSPTYTPGAPDNTTPGWSFVNAAHPLAAYPEQMFVDGVAQTQVASQAQVSAGTFYVDTVNSRLYLGSNPAGHEVLSSDLSTAITVRGAGSVVRGLGVHRYATPVPLKGAVLALAHDVTMENLTVSDNATQGIYVGGVNLGTNNTLRHVTVERNGLLGIESSYADGLRLIGVRASGNNTQHFNTSPVSGGVKIGRVRNISVSDSVFANNEGPGLWMDESVFNATVTGSDMVANSGHGISFEISSNGTFVDNLIASNGGNGMKMNNSSNLSIWNNTIVDNRSQPLWLVQDSRVASNLSTPGHDPRQALPDPTVTWLLGPAIVRNNIFARTASNCFLCVQDSALHRNAATIGINAGSNVYNRPTTTSPGWLVTWPNGAPNPMVFSTITDFYKITGQEAYGLEFTGASVLTTANTLTPALLAAQDTNAQPLDAGLAALSHHAPGERRLGAWLS